MAKSPNIGLHLTAINDTDKTFLDYRNELSGTDADSNMMILDKAVGDAQKAIISNKQGSDSRFSSIDNNISRLQQQLTSPFNFKGTVADMAALNAIKNPAQNDTYYVISEKCRYSWTWSVWQQSSMEESKYADELADLKSALTVAYALLDTTYNTQYLFNSSAIHGSYYTRQNDTITTINNATYVRYPKISSLSSGTYSFIGLARGYSFVEYVSDGSLHTFTELGATTTKGTLAIPEAFNLYATGSENTYTTSMFVDAESIPETYIEGRYNAESDALDQKMDVPENTGTYGQILMSNGDGTTSWINQQDSAFEDELEEIRDQLFNKNNMRSTLYSPNVTPVINHAYINVNGEEIAEPETSTYNVTDYIDVVSGAKITYKNLYLLTGGAYWAFYNAKYGLVESFKPTNDGAEHTITVPDSASFIRFSVKGSDVGRFTANLSYRDYLSFDVPEYYFTNDYLQSKVARIREVIRETEGNCDVFLFITDMHWLLNAQKSPALINYISKRLNIPRLIDGGDRANGINIECNVAIRKCFQGKEYFTVGNHEYINGLVDYDGNITSTFISDDGAMYAEYNAARDDVNTDNISRGYYYFDNPVQKIRYIILASFTYNGGTAAGGGYEDAQLTWFSNVVNNTAAGWHVLVITHFLVSTTLAPYRKRFTDVLTNYTGDATIIGMVEGHTHFDQVFSSDDSSATIVDGVYTTSALPILSVTCDKNTPWYSKDDPSVSETYLEDRISGTIKEQAFDVIVINKTDKVLHQIRIGCPIRDGRDPSTWTEMEERKTAFYHST